MTSATESVTALRCTGRIETDSEPRPHCGRGSKSQQPKSLGHNIAARRKQWTFVLKRSHRTFFAYA